MLNEPLERITKEQLQELYIKKGKTPIQIAKELNVYPSTISEWLKKYDIPKKKYQKEQ